MAVSSGSLPIFEETCLEWLRRLVGDSSLEAHDLRREAEKLVEELRHWRVEVPAEVARVEGMKRVFDFHRRAHTYWMSKR